jgi:hypothetical protein
MNTASSPNDQARATIQTYARIAGILFLISIIAGGFGEGWLPSRMIVSGDAAATAANFRTHDFLFRVGFAAFLIESLCDTALSLLMYVLLRPVQKDVALAAAFFGLMATSTFAFSQVFHFAPILILSGSGYLKTFTPDQLESLAYLSLRISSYAGMLFTAYYGVAWVLRAYLIVRSGYLPKLLGVLMGIGGLGFVVRNFLLILAPSYAPFFLLALLFPGGIALTVWLLVKGVDAGRWEARASSPRGSHQGVS